MLTQKTYIYQCVSICFYQPMLYLHLIPPENMTPRSPPQETLPGVGGRGVALYRYPDISIYWAVPCRIVTVIKYGNSEN